VTDPGSTTGGYAIWRNGTQTATGSWTNNTAFNHNVDGLPAGTWNYTIAAWDSYSASNVTDTVYVTVNKATPTPHLYLNGTEADKTYSTTEAMNLTGTTQSSLNVTIEFTNGTVITGPNLGKTSTTIPASNWGPGTYQVHAHSHGTANWTEAYSGALTITIGKPSCTAHLYINSSETSLQVNIGTTVNLTATVTPPGLNVTIEFANGTLISGPSPGSNTTYINTTAWGAGTYHLRAHGHGNTTYSDSYSTTLTLTITSGPAWETWNLGDAPAVWWVVAYSLSTSAMIYGLVGPTAGTLRAALTTLFMGIPTALWMLELSPLILNGTSLVTMISVAYTIGHIAVAAASGISEV